jgi:hypothetical protein
VTTLLSTSSTGTFLASAPKLLDTFYTSKKVEERFTEKLKNVVLTHMSAREKILEETYDLIGFYASLLMNHIKDNEGLFSPLDNLKFTLKLHNKATKKLHNQLISNFNYKVIQPERIKRRGKIHSMLPSYTAKVRWGGRLVEINTHTSLNSRFKGIEYNHRSLGESYTLESYRNRVENYLRTFSYEPYAIPDINTFGAENNETKLIVLHNLLENLVNEGYLSEELIPLTTMTSVLSRFPQLKYIVDVTNDYDNNKTKFDISYLETLINSQLSGTKKDLLAAEILNKEDILNFESFKVVYMFNPLYVKNGKLHPIIVDTSKCTKKSIDKMFADLSIISSIIYDTQFVKTMFEDFDNYIRTTTDDQEKIEVNLEMFIKHFILNAYTLNALFATNEINPNAYISGFVMNILDAINVKQLHYILSVHSERYYKLFVEPQFTAYPEIVSKTALLKTRYNKLQLESNINPDDEKGKNVFLNKLLVNNVFNKNKTQVASANIKSEDVTKENVSLLLEIIKQKDKLIENLLK